MADQAAKTSVEEHMQSTTIQTLQKDLDLGYLLHLLSLLLCYSESKSLDSFAHTINMTPLS